jgi:Putative auto-transporter adhesin, head GIN domain
MKTSNKLLIGSGICILLGIITHTFIMRGAYLDALKNPVSDEVNIGLKTVKYLNIEGYEGDIKFEKGNKNQILISRDLKDSLRMSYKGDTLKLDVSKVNKITIFITDIPEFNINDKAPLNQNLRIKIDSTFQSGNFKATFLKKGDINFAQCHFDKLNIDSNGSLEVQIRDCDIKLLNLNLMKYSNLSVYDTKIQSKKINLGENCTISLSGRETFSTFLK